MDIKKSIIKRIRKLRSLNLAYDFEKNYKKIPESFSFKFFEKPLVSIVIPVYNQYKYTHACLWSILNNTENFEYEIIIGDDNSSDETMHIAKKIEGITVVRNEQNLGFLLNTNNAVSHARGKYIVLMNNDIIVRKNWLDSLLKTIEQDEKVGYVGGKYLEGSGLVHEAGSFVDKNGYTGFYHQLERAKSKEVNKLKEVDYCSACGVIFKKEVWDKIGGFDEIFSPGYYEDVDLCYQIKYNLGLKIVYQPECEMYHFHGQTHGEKATKQSALNRAKFVQKWGKFLEKK